MTNHPEAPDNAERRGLGEHAGPLGGADRADAGVAGARCSFEFSPLYRPAVACGLGVQAAAFLLTAMLLDVLRTNHYCRFAVVGHWLGILVVAGRRPLSPTRRDLLFVRYGVVPLLLATPAVAWLVWAVIGESAQGGLQRLLSNWPG